MNGARKRSAASAASPLILRPDVWPFYYWSGHRRTTCVGSTMILFAISMFSSIYGVKQHVNMVCAWNSNFVD